MGVAGGPALVAPPDAPEARRADSLEQQRMQGWRPALGQEVPRRPGLGDRPASSAKGVSAKSG